MFKKPIEITPRRTPLVVHWDYLDSEVHKLEYELGFTGNYEQYQTHLQALKRAEDVAAFYYSTSFG